MDDFIEVLTSAPLSGRGSGPLEWVFEAVPDHLIGPALAVAAVAMAGAALVYHAFWG
ncbi:hypothetical protein [Falsiroseomonas sp. CW058]|uniref:hypothetical protein n=1 Tax=Falsiroseomonas sp. CW058 TaxID=3388664 RepID=UPI003D3222AD